MRAERDKVDDVIGDGPSVIDETADAVIVRARARADAVLAEARARSDRERGARGSSRRVDPERALEDNVVRQERANADETLRVERAEHAALLEHEREETDADLSRERARADDAVATRDDLLGIVSHDLRNMLSGILGFAGFVELEASREDPPAGHRERILAYARRIQRAGGRMDRLVGDLVDLASIQAGCLAVNQELGDPAPVVMEAVDSFVDRAAAGKISLLTEIAPSLPRVAFDPARILQVVINLLSNAIKFTPPGGTVVVHVDRTSDGLRFAVKDTGVGLASDRFEAVFERFVQVTKGDRRGVGLGLYISKCIVHGHGGKIWVTSTPGEGSTFCFTLPIG